MCQLGPAIIEEDEVEEGSRADDAFAELKRDSDAAHKKYRFMDEPHKPRKYHGTATGSAIKGLTLQQQRDQANKGFYSGYQDEFGNEVFPKQK